MIDACGRLQVLCKWNLAGYECRCVCVFDKESLRMGIVFSSWLHSEALVERRLCAVSRPWARAMPLSISCLSFSTAIHTPAATDERPPSRAREKSGSQSVRYIYWQRKAQSCRKRWGGGESKRSHKGGREVRNPSVSVTLGRDSFCSSITATAGCRGKKIPSWNNNACSLLSLIFHCVTSLCREP